jgi:polysaccharide biosynthesis transport protein
VLDCPPVLVVADPCIVAPRVDGVVMAVRVSQDSRPQTIRAKQLLTEIDAPIVGVVVNGWDAGTHYGQYGYGNYGSGYGYGAENANANKYYEDNEVKSGRLERAQSV